MTAPGEDVSEMLDDLIERIRAMRPPGGGGGGSLVEMSGRPGVFEMARAGLVEIPGRPGVFRIQ